MVGVALFVIASAGCGAAPHGRRPGRLRVVQGFAGGLITPQVSGFIQTLFEGEERGKAFGYFGTMVGISTAIGPLLGGALIALFGTHSGWRAVFFVNLPVGALALVLARRYLPAPKDRRPPTPRRTELDPVGVVLLGADRDLHPRAVHRGAHVAQPAAPGAVRRGRGARRVWVLHERRYARTQEPVVSLDLFGIRSYVLGTGIGTLYFAGFTGTFFILTQYLQIGLRLLGARAPGSAPRRSRSAGR